MKSANAGATTTRPDSTAPGAAEKRSWPSLSGVVVALALLLLAVPAPPLLIFDGLPWSDPFEAGALLVLMLAAIPSLRAQVVELLGDRERTVSMILVAVIGVAIVAKIALLAFGATGGFRACYRALDIDADGCAASYEDEWNLSDATRTDRVIDFGDPDGGQPPAGLFESNWNIGFMNDTRLNYYLPDEPSRGRLPLEATWEADIDPSEPTTLTLAYVGEGSVTIDETTQELEEAYEATGEATIELQPGAEALTIAYRWDEEVTAAEESTEPYAFASLTDDSGEPFAPSSGRMPGLVLDLVIALVLVAIAAGIVAALMPVAFALAGIAVFGVLAFAQPDFLVLPLGVWLIAVALAWMVCLAVPLRIERTHVLALGLIAVVVLIVAREVEAIGSFGSVIYRAGGSDFLTYENDARTMLTTGSLRGGDDVFIYSPGYRYVLFLLHGLFGEADVLPTGVSILLLVVGAVACAAALVRSVGLPQAVLDRLRPLLVVEPRPKKRKPSERAPRTDDLITIPTVIVAALLVATSASDAIATMIRSPLSEAPTWIVLPAAFTLMFLSARPGHWLAGGALIGVAATIRSEQVPALAVLLLAFVLKRLATRPEESTSRLTVLAPVAVAVVVAALPGVHNLYYGDELRFLPNTPQLPVNFPLAVGDLPSVFSDSEVRATFVSQVKGVLYVEADPVIDPATYPGGILPVTIHFVQLAWLFVVVMMVRSWSRFAWHDRLLVALPAAYLIPHVFIQVYVYYPRHIIAGYLAMAIASLWGLSRLAEVRKEQAPPRARSRSR